MNYQCELVWNRELHWNHLGSQTTDLDAAIERCKQAENMGDGECVKKTRVVDESGEVVWAYGQRVKS